MGAILSLISSRGFIAVNKQLARIYGLDEAIMLGELASEYEYWEARGEIKDGYFYSTVENVQENTTLSDRRQRAAIKTLQSAGVLNMKLKGLPKKRYFSINEVRIMEELNVANVQNKTLQNERFVHCETQDVNLAKRQTNKNNPNENKEKKNKNENIEIYTRICSYLNKKAGTNYRPTRANTQRHIDARLAEGFTVDDFIKVIDVKCAEWSGTNMDKYLRPDTLFGSKFEDYLNQHAKQHRKQNQPPNDDDNEAVKKARDKWGDLPGFKIV